MVENSAIWRAAKVEPSGLLGARRNGLSSLIPTAFRPSFFSSQSQFRLHMKRVTHAKGFHTFHTFYNVHVIIHMAESCTVLARSMLATCGMLSRMRRSRTHKHAQHVWHASDTCALHANWK